MPNRPATIVLAILVSAACSAQAAPEQPVTSSRTGNDAQAEICHLEALYSATSDFVAVPYTFGSRLDYRPVWVEVPAPSPPPRRMTSRLPLEIANSVIFVTCKDKHGLLFKGWKYRNAMTTVINNRAAIQARIAEWQRQYRNNDYGPADFLFGNPISRAERVRWFRPG